MIVPVLDDAAALRRLLSRLPSVAPGAEVVVADGGSSDEAAAVAAAHGATFTSGPACRGSQLNRGAELATRDVLWFVHADAWPPEGAAADLTAALDRPEVVGGAFAFLLRAPRPWGRVVSAGVNFRSRRLRLPYGDQGLFVRGSVFRDLGGFRPIPLMEDIEFVRRLGRAGRIAMLATPMEVSPRRWEREGPLRTTLRNQLLLAAFTLGVPAERLTRWYPSVREPG